jgi:WD40 repeat protein
MARRIRIFISSPGDVPTERLRADLVIDQLAQEYGRHFSLESYRWEHEPMLASHHFQDAIDPPSAFDIVILILWTRLGTALPERTSVREYRGIDGRAPVTGTEWEFEDALQSARLRHLPDILAFRNLQPAPIDTQDLQAQARSLEQLQQLNSFWSRHFADRGVFLAAYEGYGSLEQFAKRLEQNLRKLLERRLTDQKIDGGLGEDLPRWRGSPFRGLEAYEFEHAEIFFGRDTVVAKVVEQLANQARAGCAFLLVSGASGSGKSSLVKAAVVPRLMKRQRIEGVAFLRRAIFRPSDAGNDLFHGLVNALCNDPSGECINLPELLGPNQSTTNLANHLQTIGEACDFLFSTALAQVTRQARDSGRILAFEHAKLILVVDQLEELFTLTSISDQQRDIFIRILSGLARAGSVWVIATIRADFSHRLADSKEMIALIEGFGKLEITVPGAAELAEMIRKPAHLAGLAFEQHPVTGLGLDAVLAADAAKASSMLPLLSFALAAIYAEDVERASGRMLTHQAYESLGGLEGAITKRADETVAALSVEQKAALPRVLRALVTISGTGATTPTAHAAPLNMFSADPMALALVDALTEARLLVASSDGELSTVRIAHEALIGTWTLARQQLLKDRRDLETRALILQQYGRWQAAVASERRALLLRHPDLASARDLKKRWGNELSADLAEFIKASDQASRATARRRWIAAMSVIVILGCLAFTSLGFLSVAQKQRMRALIAQSEFLASDARTLTQEGNATLGMLLALEALPKRISTPDRPYVSEAEYALEDAVSNLRERAVLAGHGSTTWAAIYSPDGSSVVTGSDDGTARLWNAHTGEAGPVLKGHESSVNFVDFSSDGTRIATASSDATVRLWDAHSGSRQPVLRGHGDSINTVHFSHDGKWLVTASDDRTARIWDAESATTVRVLKHDGLVNTAAFSPDDRNVLTASTDGMARLWDAHNGQLIQTLAGHTDFVTVAEFSRDGLSIVTGSWDGTARVWTPGSAESLVLRGHVGHVIAATFSPDGRHIVTGSSDNTARIWDRASGAEIAVLKGHDEAVNSVTYSADGKRIATGSSDKTIRIWDAKTGTSLGVLRGHNGAVNSVVFSPDGKEIVSASTDRTARLWNTDIQAAKVVLAGHSESIASAAFSPDGQRLVTASNDRTAQVWDIAKQVVIATLTGHADRVTSAVFSPDGKTVLTASWDRTACLWDVATRTCYRKFEGHGGPLTSAAFSPDGRRIVTASSDGTARVWDVATGASLAILQGHQSWVTSAAFSPDGTQVVTGSWDTTARIWNASSGELQVTLKGHEGRVMSAVFSPDGTKILTASLDHTARIWDASRGSLLVTLSGHENWTYAATFSQDGTRVVTGSEDRTVRIWESSTGHPIMMFRGHGAAVRSASFSPDQSTIATASADLTVRLWSVPPRCQSLIEIARGASARTATELERGQFGLDTLTGDGRSSWLGFISVGKRATCE